MEVEDDELERRETGEAPAGCSWSSGPVAESGWDCATSVLILAPTPVAAANVRARNTSLSDYLSHSTNRSKLWMWGWNDVCCLSSRDKSESGWRQLGMCLALPG